MEQWAPHQVVENPRIFTLKPISGGVVIMKLHVRTANTSSKQGRQGYQLHHCHAGQYHTHTKLFTQWKPWGSIEKAVSTGCF